LQLSPQKLTRHARISVDWEHMKITTLLRLCIALFCSLLINAATAAPGDGHWDRQFAMPGTGSYGYFVRSFNNALYTGGLNLVGGQVATNTALNIFDGTNWTAMNDFYANSPSGFAILEDACLLRGQLYVGGLFIRAGSSSANGLAKWDGHDWSAVGGFGGIIDCLTSDGTNLYVGGTFTNCGGVCITNIAKWDGTNWSDLGGGLGPYVNSTTSGVFTMIWQNGLLYAGGAFTNNGNSALNNLAVWNGSSWSSVGAGVNGSIGGMAFLGTDLYVGGQFTATGTSVSAQNIAKWNGSTWSALGSGVKGASGGRPINDVAVFGGNVYITGNLTNSGGVTTSRIAKWDGANWSSIGALNGAGLRLCTNGGALYVGGSFNLAGGLVADHVARYDGDTWSAVAGPAQNGTEFFVQSLAVANDGLYAGGFFSAIGQLTGASVARFDGTNWNPLGLGVYGTYNGNTVVVRALCSAPGSVIVGGAFLNAGNISFANNIASWSPTFGWEALGDGVDNTVSAIAYSGGDVYVGGSFTFAYSQGVGYQMNKIARWNADNSAGWSSLGYGANGTVSALAAGPSGGVYVGGSFTAVTNLSSTVTANRIALWDGSSWSALGTGMSSGSVTAIFVDGGDVYVGGSFTTAGSVTARGIAKWNGTWSALGAGFLSSGTASVSAIAKLGTNIYAAGLFTNAGGSAMRVVARWDGSQWSALGSGAGGDESPGVARGLSLAVDGNNLYVGGVFETVGNGIDAGFMCRWNDQIDFTPQSFLRFTKPSGAQPGAFSFTATATAHANYAIESTTNFQTWSQVLTTDAGQLDLTNTIAAPSRFFRLKQIP
jgi:hypothetical protein